MLDNPTGEIIAYITRHLTCSNCGTPYRPSDVRVAERRGPEWTLDAVCPACHWAQVIAAYDSPPYAHLERSRGAIPSPITQDVVDEWTTFLETFDGDMADLLAHI